MNTKKKGILAVVAIGVAVLLMSSPVYAKYLGNPDDCDPILHPGDVYSWGNDEVMPCAGGPPLAVINEGPTCVDSSGHDNCAPSSYL